MSDPFAEGETPIADANEQNHPTEVGWREEENWLVPAEIVRRLERRTTEQEIA